MRHLFSILLLLVLGLSQAVPADALASGLSSGLRSGWTGKVDESRVPACCRRNGKHHCTMSAEQYADLSGQTSVAASESCPCAPQTLASTAPQLSALAQAPPAAIHVPARPRAAHATSAAVLLSDRQTQPKRGPPASQTL
jgi:hypothetical protein